MATQKQIDAVKAVCRVNITDEHAAAIIDAAARAEPFELTAHEHAVHQRALSGYYGDEPDMTVLAVSVKRALSTLAVPATPAPVKPEKTYEQGRQEAWDELRRAADNQGVWNEDSDETLWVYTTPKDEPAAPAPVDGDVLEWTSEDYVTAAEAIRGAGLRSVSMDAEAALDAVQPKLRAAFEAGVAEKRSWTNELVAENDQLRARIAELEAQLAKSDAELEAAHDRTIALEARLAAKSEPEQQSTDLTALRKPLSNALARMWHVGDLSLVENRLPLLNVILEVVSSWIEQNASPLAAKSAPVQGSAEVTDEEIELVFTHLDLGGMRGWDAWRKALQSFLTARESRRPQSAASVDVCDAKTFAAAFGEAGGKGLVDCLDYRFTRAGLEAVITSRHPESAAADGRVLVEPLSEDEEECIRSWEGLAPGQSPGGYFYPLKLLAITRKRFPRVPEPARRTGETVEDVVAEMREDAGLYGAEPANLCAWADRIEAAVRRAAENEGKS